MKFNTIAITALSIIASATQVNARRRHLNTIKGDESDASMSYMLSPERGGSSKSKSATGAPTGSPTGAPTSAPTPEVCFVLYVYIIWCIIDDDETISTSSFVSLYNHSLVNVDLLLQKISPSKKILSVIVFNLP